MKHNYKTAQPTEWMPCNYSGLYKEGKVVRQSLIITEWPRQWWMPCSYSGVYEEGKVEQYYQLPTYMDPTREIDYRCVLLTSEQFPPSQSGPPLYIYSGRRNIKTTKVHFQMGETKVDLKSHNVGE